ncbi:hypothetical protein B0H19DRAFT_1070630 [Mycena capillaripes]|nr:hypothetical protein B0H19DRAFT_1070630 [Mycena capillaripes]
MKFFSSSLLAVLALALFVCASPAPSPFPDNEVAVRQADVSPNTSILPLTIFAVFQILNLAVQAILPGIAAIVAGAGIEGQSPTASIIPLLERLATALDTATTQLAADVNDALNTLVPKLGLDAILTPLDAALTGLLTALTIPVLAPVLALVGALLVPIGGIVGGLLSALGLAGL